MNAKGPPPEFWIGFFVCFGLILVVGLLIQIFFLLTLYRTQSEVAERIGRSPRGRSGGRS